MLNVLPGRIDTRRSLRMESIDNYHPRWCGVVSYAREAAVFAQLHLDADGWLSARQVVLAAILEERIVGLVAFSVRPRIDSGGLSVEAQLDLLSVTPRFESEWIESALLQAAEDHAQTLRCDRMVRAAA